MTNGLPSDGGDGSGDVATTEGGSNDCEAPAAAVNWRAIAIEITSSSGTDIAVADSIVGREKSSSTTARFGLANAGFINAVRTANAEKSNGDLNFMALIYAMARQLAHITLLLFS